MIQLGTLLGRDCLDQPVPAVLAPNSQAHL